MPTVDHVCVALRATRALRRPSPRWTRAAVAVAVRDGADGLEVLLIERTRRPSDRWSGHVAFPGGLIEDDDADTEEAAAREAHEEVGLPLGTAIGRLATAWTVTPRRVRPMPVVPWVFRAPPLPLEPNPREVASVLWIPWRVLADPARRVRVRRQIGPLPWRFPAIRWDGRVVWGLTLTMIDDLVQRMRGA